MKILVRFGDLMLKGKNKRMFINSINSHIERKFENEDVKIDYRHDRLYIDFKEEDLKRVEKLINEIPGISSYSVIYVSRTDNESVVENAVNVLNKSLEEHKTYTFKVDTKRSDKDFQYRSIDFTILIAPMILKASNRKLKVDVNNPEITLNIDIRKDGAYIHLDKVRAMGGYPAGIAGKGLLMTSGGIDSPVAGYLAVKQGVNVELIHFESSPMTPLESVNKVIDIAKKLSVFYPKGEVKLHLVPFKEIHQAILEDVFEPYSITVMRRMMYRIAEQYANRNKIPILINGESIGQVASQTLHSIKVVEEVTKLPIIRPLATFDKRDIIDIAKRIDTFDISIRPFEDCCSIYVPKNPIINPSSRKSEKEESNFDYERLINEAIRDIRTIVVDEKTDIDLAVHGFDLKEAFENMGMK